MYGEVPIDDAKRVLRAFTTNQMAVIIAKDLWGGGVMRKVHPNSWVSRCLSMTPVIPHGVSSSSRRARITLPAKVNAPLRLIL